MPQDHFLESKLAIIEAQKKTKAAGETMAYGKSWDFIF